MKNERITVASLKLYEKEENHHLARNSDYQQQKQISNVED